MLSILAAVGSITAPAFSADDGKAHRRSGVLDEGFKELMKDELDYLQKKGADVPADAAARAKQSEDLLRLIEKAYPSLRTVTAKESEDFKQGKFDDKQTRRGSRRLPPLRRERNANCPPQRYGSSTRRSQGS